MKLRSTLAATLAATLATGMVVPAMATNKEVNVDELYAAAYNATVKAQETGTQEDIAEARKAIAALEGTDAEFAIGEFSKLVDAPQQEILVKIVDGIAANVESPSQESINEIRALIIGLKSVDSEALNWVNNYSNALDKPQQKLIDEAVVAVNKAKETGLQADIEAAQKLIDTLKTATNNEGVVNWAGAFEEAELAPVKVIKVTSLEVTSEDAITVSFNRAAKKETVEATDFLVKNAKGFSQSIEKIELAEDAKSVKIKLNNALSNGDYTVEISGIEDESGNKIEKVTEKVKFEKADVTKVSFTTEKLVVKNGSNIKDFVEIKDALGRDVTSTKDIVITTNETGNSPIISTTTGEINLTDKSATVIVNVTVKGTKISTGNVALTIEKEAATNFLGFELVKNASEVNKVTEVKEDNKVEKLTVGGKTEIALGYTNQNGEEIEAIQLGAVGVKITDLNPGVVKISGNTVTGIGKGTAKLKVVYNNIEQVITFDVDSTSKVNSIELKNSDVKISDKILKDNPQSFDFEVKDQYGNKVTTNPTDFEVRYKQADGSYKVMEDKDLSVVKVEVSADGKYKVTGIKNKENNLTTGTSVEAQIVFKADKAENEVKANLKVEILEGGAVVKHEVKTTDLNNDRVLDMATATLASDKQDTTIAFAVTGLDKDNNKVSELANSEFTLDITEKDGKKVNNLSDAKSDKILGLSELDGKGVYTVEVKVGTIVVDTVKVEVKDSTPTATTVNIKNDVGTINIGNQVTSDCAKNLSGADLKVKLFEGIEILDQNGKAMKVVKEDPTENEILFSNINLNDAVLINTEAEIISSETTCIELSKSTESFTLVLSGVTINGEKFEFNKDQKLPSFNFVVNTNEIETKAVVKEAVEVKIDSNIDGLDQNMANEIAKKAVLEKLSVKNQFGEDMTIDAANLNTVVSGDVDNVSITVEYNGITVSNVTVDII